MTEGNGWAVRRTLPVFDNGDRSTIQSLLHYAVADIDYEHPDRKEARDLYHRVREGEAVRLWIGTAVGDQTLVVANEARDADAATVLHRFVDEAEERGGEWERVAADLRACLNDHDCTDSAVEIAFEYGF